MTYNPCDPCRYPNDSCSTCPVRIERDARAEEIETERAIEKRREQNGLTEARTSAKVRILVGFAEAGKEVQ
jgi:hypothetical protein